MNDLMKAVVILGPERAGLCEVPIPFPDPGEVVVRLEGCGVCPSNIPLWEGRPWFSYPAAPGMPGHEGWGHVHAVGCGVTGLKEGDRVAFLSGSAYAEYERVPADAVLKLPHSLDGLPFPGEAVGCAVNVFRRSDIAPGQTVAIIGAGFLGAIVTALAAAAGARVVAISRRPFALDVARRNGAEELVPLDDHWQVVERLRELTGNRWCERVVEATGYQWPLDLAGELVGERGKLVIAGYHQDGLRQVNMQQWNWKGIDVINAHERDPRVYLQGIREGIRAAEAGIFDLRDLVTHQFGLGELADAYTVLKERPDGFVKGMLRIRPAVQA